MSIYSEISGIKTLKAFRYKVFRIALDKYFARFKAGINEYLLTNYL